METPKVIEAEELQIVPPTALEAIQKAEISTQIATARQYPRSMATFKKRAVDMATIDEETAESCIYVRPVGKKNGVMQYAEGLSVRMAEIVGASYGNLRVGSHIVEQTDRYVITRGYAHDLESNFASTSENKEPTVKTDGTPMSEAMRAVIAKASLAKARRDATFQVVPKALCRPIERAARALIAGNAQSMDARRANAMQFIQRLNIDAARVWAALGISGSDDLTGEHLMTLAGIKSALKDGDTTVDAAFPPIVSAGNIGSKSGKTPTEAAAAEKPKTPEPEPEKQPDAKELITQLAKKAAGLNASRSVLTDVLLQMGILSDGEKLDDLDAKRAATALDAWEQIAAILKR